MFFNNCYYSILIQFKSKTFTDFISIHKKGNKENEKINKELKEEHKIDDNKYIELEKKLNEEIEKNKILKEKIIKLKIENEKLQSNLLKANEIISCIQNNQINNNEINNLKKKIKNLNIN